MIVDLTSYKEALLKAAKEVAATPEHSAPYQDDILGNTWVMEGDAKIPEPGSKEAREYDRAYANYLAKENKDDVITGDAKVPESDSKEAADNDRLYADYLAKQKESDSNSVITGNAWVESPEPGSKEAEEYDRAYANYLAKTDASKAAPVERTYQEFLAERGITIEDVLAKALAENDPTLGMNDPLYAEYQAEQELVSKGNDKGNDKKASFPDVTNVEDLMPGNLTDAKDTADFEQPEPVKPEGMSAVEEILYKPTPDRFVIDFDDVCGEKKVVDGHELHRVVAVCDFECQGQLVKKGSVGGWVEKPENLSQKDTCWVAGEAIVMGDASVKGNALVGQEAVLKDKASAIDDCKIFGNAEMSGESRALGKARVFDSAKLKDNVVVSDEVYVFGYSDLSDYVAVDGKARVCENVVLKDSVKVGDKAELSGQVVCDKYAQIGENAKMTGNAKATDFCQIKGDTELSGNVTVSEELVLETGSFDSPLRDSDIMNIELQKESYGGR